MIKWCKIVLTGALMASLGLIWSYQALAQRYESPNYTIDASVGNSFGGSNQSAGYSMTSSGGESIVGNGSGGSYILDQGYVAQLSKSLQLSVDPAGIDLGTVVPGVSNAREATIKIQTDAPGYVVALQQDQPLTSSEGSIPGSAGSIASPIYWAESTSKGLGFSLVSASAGAIDAKWNSGGAYAAIPDAATTAYSRSGYSGGAEDNLVLRYRLDVSSSQPTGQYVNTVTYTGVMLP